MAQPKVSSAAAVDEFTVDVVFDQAMNQNALFQNPASYTIPGHGVSTVSIAIGNDTARLTLTPEGLDGQALTVTVDSGLENTLAETMDVGFLSAGFTAIGVDPQVSAAEAQDEVTVRVTFDEIMNDNAALSLPGNYVFTETTGVAITATAVTPEGGGQPTYVDVTVNEMTDAASYSVEVSNVEDAVGNPIDVANDTAVFAGLGVAPTITALATALDTIRVTFSEPVQDDAALVNLANYVFSEPGGGNPIAFDLITPEAVAFPTYVDVNVTSEMTEGIGNYELAVSNVLDQANNAMGAPTNTALFNGFGRAPRLSGISVVSSTRLRFNFDEPMLGNAELENPANYVVTPITPGAASLFFSAVDVPNAAFPEWVDIDTSEMTDGASYSGQVSNVQDIVGNVIDPGFDSDTFVGVGEAPEVERVEAISENRVDVYFNEHMTDNADIRDPAKYSFDNGLAVLSILSVSGSKVELVTGDQVEGTLYTLTVVP
jgi:hypothetical protein